MDTLDVAALAVVFRLNHAKGEFLLKGEEWIGGISPLFLL